eukprot:3840819-Prymnesium_polylepis.1
MQAAHDPERTLAAIGGAPLSGYAEFRKMLNLPPAEDGLATLIPIDRGDEAVDPSAAVRGAMCLAAKREAEKRKQ